jgi:hypothetical protein
MGEDSRKFQIWIDRIPFGSILTSESTSGRVTTEREEFQGKPGVEKDLP